MLSDELLKKIALYDENTQIQTIQEVYLDYFIINSNLYHLGIESSLNLSFMEEKLWDRYENFTFNRIVEGVISVCLSNRVFPVIKCIKNSYICKRISVQVAEFFQENNELIRRECSREQNGLLFIYDRREDPITPLLNQWTYQSMLHELLGINNNIIEIKHSNSKSDKGDEDSQKLTLSDYDDKFFSKNLYNEFDEVADEIKRMVEKLNKEQENIDKKVDSVEDLKKFIEKLPEKKKESAEVTKHTNLFYELSEIMKNRKLLELATLEQDMACSENKKDHYNKLTSIIKDIKYHKMDKAKLYLIFCLRYEDDSSISILKNLMIENNLKEWVEYSDYLLMFSGKRKRSLDVLSNKDFLAKSSKIITNFIFKNQNVFFQHVSYLNSIMERILKGKIKDNEVETVYKVGDREK
jgi:vacuolar protein sorting-associated protein 45